MSERVRLYYQGVNWHKQDFDDIKDACDYLCSIHSHHWAVIPLSDLTPEQHRLMVPPDSATVFKSASFNINLPFFDEEQVVTESV